MVYWRDSIILKTPGFEFPYMRKDQLKNSFRIASLIIRYRQDELNEQQTKELFDWVESSKENKKLFDELNSEPYIKLALQELKQTDSLSALERVHARIDYTCPPFGQKSAPPPPRSAAADLFHQSCHDYRLRICLESFSRIEN
jgi:hypothetical protein